MTLFLDPVHGIVSVPQGFAASDLGSPLDEIERLESELYEARRIIDELEHKLRTIRELVA